MITITDLSVKELHQLKSLYLQQQCAILNVPDREKEFKMLFDYIDQELVKIQMELNKKLP